MANSFDLKKNAFVEKPMCLYSRYKVLLTLQRWAGHGFCSAGPGGAAWGRAGGGKIFHFSSGRARYGYRSPTGGPGRVKL